MKYYLFLVYTHGSSSSSVYKISEYVYIKVDIVKNYGMVYHGAITFTNVHSQDIEDKDWEIYFSNFFVIQYVHKPGAEILNISHVNGYIHKIFPSAKFFAFKSHLPLVIHYNCSGTNMARTQNFPNWYVVNKKRQIAIIKSTEGESLDFVNSYLSREQLTRL